MKKSQILPLYKKVAAQTAFQENPKNPGWEPKLGPDNYRSVIRHGTFKGKSAVLTVSPYTNLEAIAKDLQVYQSVPAGTNVVTVPYVLEAGLIGKAFYLIQEEMPQGRWLLSEDYHSTDVQKRLVAHLYWDTVRQFSKTDITYPEWSAADYFLDMLNRRLAEGRNNQATGQGWLLNSDKEKAVKIIFDNLSGVAVEPFFSHFANTDLVWTDHRVFIWNAPIVPKAEAAGVAFWIWGATLHAWNWTPDAWIKEVESWIGAFIDNAPENRKENLYQKIRINLLERLLNTLMVDLPNKRSPFESATPQQLAQVTSIVKNLFFHLL